jgi:hypothetical protein
MRSISPTPPRSIACGSLLCQPFLRAAKDLGCGRRTDGRCRQSAPVHSLLPKRRGRPLRSATKPCVRLVTSHGSSILRSVVIDTLRFVVCMPLVMAVLVKGKLITEFLSTTHTCRE